MHKHSVVIINYMCSGLSGSVCPYWPRYKQLVWQFVWPLIHKERRASCGEEGLSPRAWSVCSHTQTHLTHKPKSSNSVNTDPCERPGFMELMGGCMGTFPGGSFCLFFWWRRRRRRPSSSHHDDRRAERERAEEEECISAVGVLWEITAEVIAPLVQAVQKTCKNWLCGKRRADDITAWKRSFWADLDKKKIEKKQWPDWQNHVSSVYFKIPCEKSGEPNVNTQQHSTLKYPMSWEKMIYKVEVGFLTVI